MRTKTYLSVFAISTGLVAFGAIPAASFAQATTSVGAIKPAAVQADQSAIPANRMQTDAALREGMTNIRKIVEPYIPLIRAGKFGDGHYSAVGDAVDAQIAYIVKNCKLEPEADNVLHGLLARLQDGTERIRGKTQEGDRSEGITPIVSALDDYGRYFDHPGWQPVNPGQ